MKQYSAFDKKGGFTVKIKQYRNGLGIQFRQFNFEQGNNNKANVIKLDPVECSDIADQINANLRTYPQWNAIKIFHKFKDQTGTEIMSSLTIDTYDYNGKSYISVSTRVKDISLSTSCDLKTIRFLAKVLNHFALEALEVTEQPNYNNQQNYNNYQNQGSNYGNNQFNNQQVTFQPRQG